METKNKVTMFEKYMESDGNIAVKITEIIMFQS